MGRCEQQRDTCAAAPPSTAQPHSAQELGTHLARYAVQPPKQLAHNALCKGVDANDAGNLPQPTLRATDSQ